jgi:hypothetical protein
LRRVSDQRVELDHAVLKSRNADLLGKHRPQLRALQRKKGPHAAGSPHEAVRQPVKPSCSPLLAIKLGNPKYES